MRNINMTRGVALLKPRPTKLLKVVTWLFGSVVLILCLMIAATLVRDFQEDMSGYRLILIGMLVAAVPFFIGLYQTFKLLNYIDQGQADFFQFAAHI